MKKHWFAVFAALAVLLGAEQFVVAQGLSPNGTMSPGSVVQGSNGQAYMVVPDYSAPLISPVGYSGAAAAGYDSKCCDGNCGKSNCDTCSPQGWCDRYFAYGGLLYLRSRDSEVAYAMPVTGPVNPAVNGIANAPAGAVRVLDQDFSAGFFVGFGRYLDECSSIGVQYNQFNTQTGDTFTLAGGGPFIRSLISLPASTAADVDGLNSTASHAIKYQTFDVDYRNLFAYDCDYRLNYVVGVRIAQLNQNLDATFTQLGTVRNTTDIDFYGAGVRFGLEGERDVSRGFMVYGKGYLNLVPGEFRADYTQTSSTAAATSLNTSWSGGRIVTMADLETGITWVNACGNLRLSAGYVFSAWTNVVQTDEWIKAAQTSNFTSSFNNMGSTMTFDGLVARIEGRW